MCLDFQSCGLDECFWLPGLAFLTAYAVAAMRTARGEMIDTAAQPA